MAGTVILGGLLPSGFDGGRGGGEACVCSVLPKARPGQLIVVVDNVVHISLRARAHLWQLLSIVIADGNGGDADQEGGEGCALTFGSSCPS